MAINNIPVIDPIKSPSINKNMHTPPSCLSFYHVLMEVYSKKNNTVINDGKKKNYAHDLLK
jgi:hypothetical protein